MKKFLLPALMLVVGSVQAQLLTEDFESYNVGDYIGVVAPAWETWNANGEGTEEDAPVTDEAAQSGSQSLKISGDQLGPTAGGPLDVMLAIGLEDTVEVTFSILVPDSSAGYYNMQEAYGTGGSWGADNGQWAFSCFFNSDGTMQITREGVTHLDTTYTPGEWLKVTHFVDINAGLLHLYHNDEYMAQLPYDGTTVGGINFYALGDASVPPLFYIDDVYIDRGVPLTDGLADLKPIECQFGPNPAQDFIWLQANLQDAQIRVLGLDGKVVMQERRNDLAMGTDLQLNLENGIYLLELTNGSKRVTRRLVIQK